MAPNWYHVPGQWPDSQSLYNIIDPPAPSLLLELPPEIRNLIYAFALRLDKGICRVSTMSGVPEPALLLTCKEIRREAIGIFYVENEVHLTMQSYSPAMPIFILGKELALHKQYRCKVNVAKVHLRGPPRWRNLVSWLRSHHENLHSSGGSLAIASALGTLAYTDEAKKGDHETAVVAGMFLMTFTMRKLPWDQVEPTLELLRYGLTRYNAEWKVD